MDEVDLNNYKGIFFEDEPGLKYVDEVTGAHFEYRDVCLRLKRLQRCQMEEGNTLESSPTVKPDDDPALLEVREALLQPRPSQKSICPIDEAEHSHNVVPEASGNETEEQQQQFSTADTVPAKCYPNFGPNVANKSQRRITYFTILENPEATAVGQDTFQRFTTIVQKEKERMPAIAKAPSVGNIFAGTEHRPVVVMHKKSRNTGSQATFEIT